MGLDAVDRMAAVLAALDGAQCNGGDATLNDVCATTGLSRSTASRFLNALVDHEFVYRSAEGTFSLGSAPGALGLAPLGHRRLGEIAHPHMRSLANDVNEAACISVFDGAETQTIHQVGVPQPVFVENWVDRRWPILPSGSAMSIMSTWSPAATSKLLAQLPKDKRQAIADSITAARSTPISWSEGDYVDVLTSVAAPILDRRGHATSALIIYGPSYRFPGDRGRAAIEKKLTTAAAAISEDLY